MSFGNWSRCRSWRGGTWLIFLVTMVFMIVLVTMFLIIVILIIMVSMIMIFAFLRKTVHVFCVHLLTICDRFAFEGCHATLIAAASLFGSAASLCNDRGKIIV